MENTIKVSLTTELVSDFLSYTTAIYNRALPDIVDGLKVAQRRAIVGVKDLNLASNSSYCKVSRLEGHVLGKYHPQGGCSGTIINLGQQSSTRYCLTDIHGNVGGSIQTGTAIGQLISEDSPAAPRYLEVRSTSLAEKIYISEIERGLGEWRPNYDDSTNEPVRIVPSLPAILLTGAQGIASGYACYHLPYRINDVILATKLYIKNNKITDKQLLSKFTSPPEFAQGGRVSRSKSDLAGVVLKGRGQVEVLGDWQIEVKTPWGKRSTRPALVVTRLAYGSSEKFLEKVRDLADSDKLPGLIDASDHSTREGIRIVLVAKTVEDIKNTILPALMPNTGLKHVYNINCTAVGVDGLPKTVGVREVIKSWYEERVKYLIDKNKSRRDKLEREVERLEAVSIILSDIDKFLKLVRRVKDTESAIGQISKTWKLTREVSSYLLSIPIRTLIRTESDKVKSDLELIRNDLIVTSQLCAPGQALDDHLIGLIPSEKQLGFEPRCSWTNEEIQVKVQKSPPSPKEKIFSEGKTLGMSTQKLNRWVLANTGTGRIMEKWEEYKASIGKKPAKVKKILQPNARNCKPDRRTKK